MEAETHFPLRPLDPKQAEEVRQDRVAAEMKATLDAYLASHPDEKAGIFETLRDKLGVNYLETATAEPYTLLMGVLERAGATQVSATITYSRLRYLMLTPVTN